MFEGERVPGGWSFKLNFGDVGKRGGHDG